MKLYSFHPDASSVARHFQSMARGELKDQTRRQIGYGHVGSKLKIGGGSVMKRLDEKKAPAVLQQVTPVEVGLQQANAELTARKMFKKKKAAMIAASLGGVVKKKKGKKTEVTKRKKRKEAIKPSAKSSSSHSGSRKRGGKTKDKTKRSRVKKHKRADNFS